MLNDPNCISSQQNRNRPDPYHRYCRCQYSLWARKREKREAQEPEVTSAFKSMLKGLNSEERADLIAKLQRNTL